MKLLVFAPFSAIWVHAFPEALVIESLQKSGHEIVYITCDRQFSDLCVAMGAHGIGVDAPRAVKDRVCDLCETNKSIIGEGFGFPGFELGQLLYPAELEWIEFVCKSTRPDTIFDLTIDGIPVGKCALSHFLINAKKMSLTFSETDWTRLQVELRNTLRAFVGCRRAIEREKPDRLLVYTAPYSVNLVCCELAAQRSIPHYYMAAAGNLSDRLQKLVVARDHGMHFQKNNIANWSALSHVPCSASQLAYVTDHFKQLFRGKNPFVYSAAMTAGNSDLRSYFGIEPQQKVLTAVLSSYDEVYAAQMMGLWPTDFESIFATQIDWLQALLNYVSSRPDLFLIVRVHPREMPNRRDSVSSENSTKLAEALSNLPDNVWANWPDEQLSLYQIAEITDVCLNAWSSAGKELTVLGLPVVTYAPDLLIYPPSLNRTSDTVDGYFAQIEAAIAEGWSSENVRRGYRWYVLEYERAMIDLSKSYAYSENFDQSLATRVFNRLRRTIDPTFLQRGDVKRRAERLPDAALIDRLLTEKRATILDLRLEAGIEGVSIEDETAALKLEVKRLVSIMYPGGRPRGGAAEKLMEFAEYG